MNQQCSYFSHFIVIGGHYVVHDCSEVRQVLLFFLTFEEGIWHLDDVQPNVTLIDSKSEMSCVAACQKNPEVK